MRRMAQLWRCRRGSSAVEFVLVAPVMLGLLFAFVETGRYLWIRQALQHAADEATRYGIADSSVTLSQIQDYARDRAPFTGSEVTATAQVVAAGGVNYLTVTLTYPFSFIVPFMTLADHTLTGRTRMPLR